MMKLFTRLIVWDGLAPFYSAYIYVVFCVAVDVIALKGKEGKRK